MLQRTKSWGTRKSPQPYQQEKASPRRPPQPERTLVLRSHLRSDLACAVYPDKTPKDASIQVAQDIAHVPSLRADMYRLGYKPGKKGYSNEQIATLLRFYKKRPSPAPL